MFRYERRPQQQKRRADSLHHNPLLCATPPCEAHEILDRADLKDMAQMKHADGFSLLAKSLRIWHHGCNSGPGVVVGQLELTDDFSSGMCSWVDVVERLLCPEKLKNAISFDGLTLYTAMLLSYNTRSDATLKNIGMKVVEHACFGWLPHTARLGILLPFASGISSINYCLSSIVWLFG